MNKSRWVVTEPVSVDFREQFPEYPEFFVTVLKSRCIETRESLNRFLNPNYDRDLHNPLLLKDIQKATDRLWRAIDSKESIVVWGDYDADGIPACAILSDFLVSFSANFEVKMADRNTDGHGLNKKFIDECIAGKVGLVITLDCGTTNHKEIKIAQDSGVDVIVIDHHQVVDELPPAHALVNPHQEGDEYPFKNLCGASLAFKFLKALVQDPRARGKWANGEDKWLLDLVAIGTISDMGPIID
jgi:single-stranded-DNA-specific exonuclease